MFESILKVKLVTGLTDGSATTNTLDLGNVLRLNNNGFVPSSANSLESVQCSGGLNVNNSGIKTTAMIPQNVAGVLPSVLKKYMCVVNSQNTGLAGPNSNNFSDTRKLSSLMIRVGNSYTDDFPVLFVGSIGGNNGVTGSWIQVQDKNNSTGNLCLNPIGGNVGVGTLNPLTALHVNGEVRATTTTAGSDPNTLTTKNYVDKTPFRITYGIGTGTQFTVSPPSGYVMADLQGFIPSIRTIYFTGVVDANDYTRCIYTIRASDILVQCQNSEQSSSSANWIAFWKKP